MQSIAFYQAHLDRVSRSFAFCIPQLGSPFREWVSLSYLLCRVLDTVEDSAWSDPALRELQYRELEGFLNAPAGEAVVRAWSERFPTSIPERERVLLADSVLLFSDLHGMPPGAQAVIRDTVLRMSAGMRHYAEVASEAQVKLEDLKEVNRYCYFVAGIVGELLTRLYLEYRPDYGAPDTLLKNAYHFGLFLQKVNLLKDQRGDEAEGRFLVPDREEMLISLREHAVRSVEYLTSLPLDEKGYRTFCAWSLFLGVASLPFIQQSYEQADATKISRAQTEALLGTVAEMAQDNEAIWARLDEMLALLPKGEVTTGGEAEEADWFRAIRGPALRPEELSEIGVA